MSDMKTSLHYEEEGDTIIINNTQDCSEVLKQLDDERDNYKGEDMWKVASIPLVLIEKYLNETGVSYNEFMQDGEKHIMRLLTDNSRLQLCNL